MTVRFFVPLVLALAMPISAMADPGPSAVPAQPVASEPVLEGRFSNGLRYVVENSGPGARIELRLVVAAGYVSDRPDEPQFAHLLEHVLVFAQTPDGKETRDIYASWGMSGQVNAWTTTQATIYQNSLVGPAKKHLGDVIALLGQVMLQPHINDIVVARESAAVLAEMRESLTTVTVRDAEAVAWFGDAARPQTSAVLLERLPRVTGRELQAFFEREYAPGRMTMIVVGDVDPGATLALLEKAFGGRAVGAPATDGSLQNPSRSMPKVATVVTNANIGEAIRLQALRVHRPGSGVARRDPRSLAAATIARKILLDRARTLIERDGSPLRDVQFEADQPMDFIYAPAFVTLINPKYGRIDEAVAAVEALLADIARTGVTLEEVDAAKAAVIKAPASPVQGDAVARMQLWLDQMVPAPWGNEIPPQYREIAAAVDAATVSSELRSWLAAKPGFLSLSAPRAPLIEGYDETRLAAMFLSPSAAKRPAKAASPPQAELRFASAAPRRPCPPRQVYTGRVWAGTVGCSDSLLVAGPQETGEAMAPLVYLSGVMPRGFRALPEGMRDEAALAASIMDGFGNWAGLDRFARANLFAVKGISLRAEADDEAVRLFASAPAENAHLLAPLIGELLSHSRLIPAALDDFRVDIAEGFRRSAAAAALPRATPKSLEAAWRSLVRDGDGFTWAVAGPYDLDTIRKGLSALGGRSAGPIAVANPMAQDAPVVAEVDEGEGVPADAKVVSIIMRRSLALPYDERLVPTVDSANALLGARLFNRLRVVEHGVYSVTGGLRQDAASGRQMLEIRFNCEPARANALIAAAQEEVDRLSVIADAEFEVETRDGGLDGHRLPVRWAPRIAEAVAFGAAVADIDRGPNPVTAEGVRGLFGGLLAEGAWNVAKTGQR